MIETDYLVVGSGIAGLYFSLFASDQGARVAIVTKRSPEESNTNYAQGGIAAVMSELDSFESHVRDTLIAGAGLCDDAVVRLTVSEAPARVRELQELGVRFSEREAVIDLGLEAGHSHRRILHAGDITGREIERALVASVRRDKNVTLIENALAVDLMLDKSGAAFNPVAVVQIVDAVDHPVVRSVDMPANHALAAARMGLTDHGFLKT